MGTSFICLRVTPCIASRSSLMRHVTRIVCMGAARLVCACFADGERSSERTAHEALQLMGAWPCLCHRAPALHCTSPAVALRSRCGERPLGHSTDGPNPTTSDPHDLVFFFLPLIDENCGRTAFVYPFGGPPPYSERPKLVLAVARVNVRWGPTACAVRCGQQNTTPDGNGRRRVRCGTPTALRITE